MELSVTMLYQSEGEVARRGESALAGGTACQPYTCEQICASRMAWLKGFRALPVMR